MQFTDTPLASHCRTQHYQRVLNWSSWHTRQLAHFINAQSAEVAHLWPGLISCFHTPSSGVWVVNTSLFFIASALPNFYAGKKQRYTVCFVRIGKHQDWISSSTSLAPPPAEWTALHGIHWHHTGGVLWFVKHNHFPEDRYSAKTAGCIKGLGFRVHHTLPKPGGRVW